MKGRKKNGQQRRREFDPPVERVLGSIGDAWIARHAQHHARHACALKDRQHCAGIEMLDDRGARGIARLAAVAFRHAVLPLAHLQRISG